MSLSRQFTPSSRSYQESTGNSRIELMRPALSNFLINVKQHHPDHVVRLVLFNHTTTIIDGSIDALQDYLPSIVASGGTDMVECFNTLKKEYDLLPNERRDRLLCALLTDGAHTGSIPMDDYKKDAFFQGLFRSIIGIGTADTVDHDLLSTLANQRPDVYHLVSEEQEVSDTMNGSYFELLTARYTDVKITMWCENDASISVPASVRRVYYTKETFDDRMKPDKPCSFLSVKHQDSTFFIESMEPESSTSVPDPIHQPREFWLVIDTSGSMGDIVHPPEQVVFETADQDDSKPYVSLTYEISSVGSHTHMMGGGHIKDVTVTYTNPTTKTIYHERVTCGSFQASETPLYQVGTKMVHLTHLLGKRLTKYEIQQAYRNHLDFLHQLESMPLWMQAQGKTLWHNLKMRYKSTLSVGEQFFHQTPMALGMLMRATSSSAASQSATPHHSVQPLDAEQDMEKCKLCYEKAIDVVFPECRHTGVCTSCYTTYLNQTGKRDCPFCRTEITTWSVVRLEESGTICKYCTKQGCYVGHLEYKNGSECCGHMLYCNSCKAKHGTVCQVCKTNVQAVRIYLC